MSATSLFPVKFEGGPRAGESTETKGEPKRLLALRDGASGGHYRLEWDRRDGVRLRSGTYVWEPAQGDALVEPTSGDEASALIEKADGLVAAKPGASMAFVPDITAKAAESTLTDVADQLAALEQERQAEPTFERTEGSDARVRSVARGSASKASTKTSSTASKS